VAQVGLHRSGDAGCPLVGFIRDHYMKVKSRRGTKDARCSAVRRIAEITYTVWSEGLCWEETRS
jgi:hypothetical protein